MCVYVRACVCVCLVGEGPVGGCAVAVVECATDGLYLYNKLTE